MCAISLASRHAPRLNPHVTANDPGYLLANLPPHGLYLSAWLDEDELAGYTGPGR